MMTAGTKAAATTEEEKKDIRSSLVIQRVVRETCGSWPMLNRTNYTD